MIKSVGLRNRFLVFNPILLHTTSNILGLSEVIVSFSNELADVWQLQGSFRIGLVMGMTKAGLEGLGCSVPSQPSRGERS
jgi:hypothetical protein